jgi:acetoin:2,6-dichlorophenolindophenol oxidoreductase subunit alpha
MAKMSTIPEQSNIVDEISGEQLGSFLAAMLRIRYFEEKLEWIYGRGLMHGTMHLYIGEEATAVGVLAARQPGDLFTSTHRGHGHCIAGGALLWRMFAELLGKEEGYCRGRGGSMHIADLAAGNLGANGVVGGSIGIAVGAALTQRMKQRPSVVFCFFGDGAINQGIFHESANMAAIWNLPVVFVCENNGYGISLHYRKAMRQERISRRALSYGFPGVTVDGNDVIAVFQAAQQARRQAVSEGPVLLECVTYRWRGHSRSDANRYRTKEEIEQWKQRCPIRGLRERLLHEGVLTESELNRIDQEVEKEVLNAFEMAQSCSNAEPIRISSEVYA